jgi:hypothetical protein
LKIRCYFPPGEPNTKIDDITATILDDDLIKEIDSCIVQLGELKVDVEERRGLFRQRLMEEEGVIKKTLIANL